MRSYIMSEKSREESLVLQKKKRKDRKKSLLVVKRGYRVSWRQNTSEAHTHTHSFQLFSFCVCNFIFPLPAYGIPYEYFRESPLSFLFVPPSLALPLLLCSLGRYCDVSSLCPSLPLPLSLSLSPSIAL